MISLAESQFRCFSRRVSICGPTALGVVIGSMTFFGSVVAGAKLQGYITSKAIHLPANNMINILLALSWVGGTVGMCLTDDQAANLAILLVCFVTSAFVGVHMVIAIGGADMPVVVSMLVGGGARAPLLFVCLDWSCLAHNCDCVDNRTRCRECQELAPDS